MKAKSQITQWLLAILLSSICPLTMAAGMEAEVTSTITMVRNVVYAVVGAIAGICLVWAFAQGFMGRKTWGDILETCLWIFGAGAGLVLATWLFAKGAAMVF